MSSDRPGATASTTKKLVGLCRPFRWQLVFGGFRHEREHEEGIECRPELFGVVNVVGCVVPEEKLVPRFVKKLLTKLLDGV
jgi:hypothetical protein